MKENGAGRMPIVILSALIGALMLLAACGSGDDDEDGDGGGDATLTEAAGDDGGEDETPPVDGGGEPTNAGGGNDDGDSGDWPNICALLTEDEIAEATGVTFGFGDNQDFSPFYGCGWVNEEFDSVTVSVTSRDEGGGEALFDIDLGAEKEDVDGLGDRAQWVKGALPLLEVLDGDWYVSIEVSVSDFDEAQKKEASIQLAEAVLGRLP